MEVEVKFKSLGIKPNEVYVLACSYGPDSMCLFDLLLKNEVKFVVAHVNYHKRKEAGEEERALRRYCDQNKVPFYFKGTHYQKRYGNFQSWAREVRYKFFQEIYENLNADGLFIAHQEDDVIETYMIQIQRDVQVFNYGLLEETSILSMRVLRPLLENTKKQIMEYCALNSVPFAVDSSNKTPVYTRNRIRIDVVSQMSPEERQKVLEEISKKNKELLDRKSQLDKEFSPYGFLELGKILHLPDNDLYYVLYKMTTQYIPPRKFDQKTFKDIKKLLVSQKPNSKLSLSSTAWLMREYGKIYVANFKALKPYLITVPNPQKLTTPYLVLRLTGDLSNLNITHADFPLTIRSSHAKDAYRIKDYSVQVRRLFIDWKMPSCLRIIWPVIINNKNQIIYIPRYRADYVSNGTSAIDVLSPHLITAKK